MRFNYPYLKDTKFLKQVDRIPIRTQYVKVTVLNWEEEPIESIEGIATSGSINIDGRSSVRRTANLTLIADGIINNIENIDNLISLNKKVAIETGLKNTINNTKYNNYDTLWFPQGIYVVCGVSISHDAKGTPSISLQLKDKMCLLNGDVSGVISAAVTLNEMDVNTGISFDTEQAYQLDGEITEDGGLITIEDNLLYYSDEEKYALIVDGLSSSIAAQNIVQPTIYQIIQEVVNHFGGEQLSKIIISDIDNRVKQAMQWIGNTPLYLCKKKIYDEDGALKETSIFFTVDEAKVAAQEGDPDFSYETISAGGNVGYIYTDFVYPGELIANAGDTVCSILDKIRDTLGNYEYFYDVQGNFVFQEIKNYLNTTQAKLIMKSLNDENKTDYFVDIGAGSVVYDFSDNLIVSSYSNAPQYNMVKNDFLVWGERTTSSGQKYPIRYHLAIDSKPKVGNTYICVKYQEKIGNDYVDKYAAAIHYTYTYELPVVGLSGVFYKCDYYKPTPTSGEAQKLSDKLFFLYNEELKGYNQVLLESVTITTTDWRSELFLSGQQAAPLATDSNYYFTELSNEWTKIYDLEKGQFKDEALNNPTSLDYYLDLIDDGSSISQFSVNNIGRRQKVITDTNVNCIFEPYIEDIILVEAGKDETSAEVQECIDNQQQFVQVPSNVYNALAIGNHFYSAYDAVRDLLYQYTSYNETVSLQTLPIFYLEPNVRISIRDTESDIYGIYMISNISVPLSATGTMSISCTKALDKI